jgi:hypothetical protein
MAKKRSKKRNGSDWPGPRTVYRKIRRKVRSLEESGQTHARSKEKDKSFGPISFSPAMPLYWLCYRHNNQISVVIEPVIVLLVIKQFAGAARLL